MDQTLRELTHFESQVKSWTRQKVKAVPNSDATLTAGSRTCWHHVRGACGTGIEKAGRQFSRRWVPLGLWDRILISEMWDHLITNRLVEEATGLGVKGRI